MFTLPRLDLRDLANIIRRLCGRVRHMEKEEGSKPINVVARRLLYSICRAASNTAAVKAITLLCFGSNPTPARPSCAATAAPARHCFASNVHVDLPRAACAWDFSAGLCNSWLPGEMSARCRRLLRGSVRAKRWPVRIVACTEPLEIFFWLIEDIAGGLLGPGVPIVSCFGRACSRRLLS